ncbi:MAG: peptidoglycan bridge formation glycyltransferase FemA/FemB family protein [Anaerolineaceae bacterium]|nr:peptidoglycan bridge formation glycyltransferase FemA/FemB family protein [Anaerolineaceae bacterium]
MDREQWNTIISGFDQSSILQSWEWSQLKSQYGWMPDYFVKKDSSGKLKAVSLILARSQRIIKFGPEIKVLYLPHGPLLDWNNLDIVKETLDSLKEYSEEHNAAYIKIDPQFITSHGIESDTKNCGGYSSDIPGFLEKTGWRYSNQQIQFKNTFWINLILSEDELLARMKQKTRYNIRLAEKKGVLVKKGTINDLNLLYEMYAETSLRDGFIIRPREYYVHLWRSFINAGMAIPLLAEVEGEPVAALFLFHFNQKSYYLHGMSCDVHREKMPNYLLQWEAIKLSKSLGCRVYDLWGAPEVFNSSDKMWGVYKFKEGLGGEIIQTLGAYDYPTSKLAYTIIQKALPKFQSIARKIRGKQIRDELSG